MIRRDDGLVLVANRRRDQSIDWTPPGGVIDPGETIGEGLVREVREETGLVVHDLVRCAYRVEVQAPELDWILTVEAWEVDASGEVCIWGDVRLSTRLQFIHLRSRAADPVVRALVELLRDLWTPPRPVERRPVTRSARLRAAAETAA